LKLITVIKNHQKRNHWNTKEFILVPTIKWKQNI